MNKNDFIKIVKQVKKKAANLGYNLACDLILEELEKIEDDTTICKMKPPTKLECPDYGEKG